MNRLQRFFLVLLVFLATGVSAETGLGSVPLVSRDDIVLTDQYVKQAFAADKRTRQDAVISHPQRFKKYIENRWIELNLIEQVKHGAVPDGATDLDQLMKLVEQTVLAKLMIEQLAKEQIGDLDTAARNKYQQDFSHYKLPDRVKVSHILIETGRRSDEDAQKLAEQVRAEVIAGNASFSDLALKYSDDPSVHRNHGNLGFFSRGQMTKPFEEAAFSMSKPGEISSVVKTRFGYHIIRFEDRQTGRVQPFSAVRDKIKNQLKAQRQQFIWNQYKDKVATGKNTPVGQNEVKTWLWFAGLSDEDESSPVWKETCTKLGMAKLLAHKAAKTKFDLRSDVRQKIELAKRQAMIKLRRKTLYDEIAKHDLSAAVKERYLANIDQYVVPEKADVSIIFLSNKKHSAEAFEQLTDLVYRQVENSSVDFETLALKYSDAPEVKKNKGHLGPKQSGELGKQLSAAIFVQKKPALLKPLKTPGGVFIIRINKLYPQRQLSFDEVKDSIKASIVNNMASQQYTQLAQSILNHPGNKVDDAAVDQLYTELKQSR